MSLAFKGVAAFVADELGNTFCTHETCHAAACSDNVKGKIEHSQFDVNSGHIKRPPE